MFLQFFYKSLGTYIQTECGAVIHLYISEMKVQFSKIGMPVALKWVKLLCFKAFEYSFQLFVHVLFHSKGF